MIIRGKKDKDINVPELGYLMLLYLAANKKLCPNNTLNLRTDLLDITGKRQYELQNRWIPKNSPISDAIEIEGQNINLNIDQDKIQLPDNIASFKSIHIDRLKGALKRAEIFLDDQQANKSRERLENTRVNINREYFLLNDCEKLLNGIHQSLNKKYIHPKEIPGLKKRANLILNRINKLIEETEKES